MPRRNEFDSLQLARLPPRLHHHRRQSPRQPRCRRSRLDAALHDAVPPAPQSRRNHPGMRIRRPAQSMTPEASTTRIPTRFGPTSGPTYTSIAARLARRSKGNLSARGEEQQPTHPRDARWAKKRNGYRRTEQGIRNSADSPPRSALSLRVSRPPWLRAISVAMARPSPTPAPRF